MEMVRVQAVILGPKRHAKPVAGMIPQIPKKSGLRAGGRPPFQKHETAAIIQNHTGNIDGFRRRVGGHSGAGTRNRANAPAIVA